MVDLLGLVISVSPTSSIQKWDGIETVRHTIGLHDMSGYSIDIPLWGEHFQIEGTELANLCGLDTPLVLAIKCGHVIEFNGKIVGTILNTTLFKNTNIEETILPQIWFDNNGFHSASPSLSQKFNSSHFAPRKSITINELQNLESFEKGYLVLYCCNHHKC